SSARWAVGAQTGHEGATSVNPALSFLLSSVYAGDLAPAHLADLRKSGLTDETIRLQRIRSVPIHMLGQLLGFDVLAIQSAMLLPSPDPGGGWMPLARVKVFPPLKDAKGHTTKYLQPRGSGPRLFFPLATLAETLHGDAPLWLCEGEKKALAVAQHGLPAIAICGVEGWHVAGSRGLLADFHHLGVHGRVVKLIPDGDFQSNPAVARAINRLADALEHVGACVRLLMLPG